MSRKSLQHCNPAERQVHAAEDRLTLAWKPIAFVPGRNATGFPGVAVFLAYGNNAQSSGPLTFAIPFRGGGGLAFRAGRVGIVDTENRH